MAYREFTDRTGVSWRAWDTRPHSAANVRARYAGGWLSFESARERRRLHPIPEAWADAPEHELWGWLAAAEPAELSGESRVPLLDVGMPVPDRAAGATGGAEPDAGHASGAALLESTRDTVLRARAVIQLVNVTIAGSGAAPPTPDVEPDPAVKF